MNITPSNLFIALVGGILPALLWLWFWLHEDRLSPEPRRLIIYTFLGGMAAVAVALIAEQRIALLFPLGSLIIIVLWAATEELVKFGSAWFIALRRPENDEPIDSMVYLITAAVGFAALENVLFLLGPLGGGNFVNTFVTSNLRFVGSTLLHIVSSSAVGIFLAFSFCELRNIKRISAICGLILAIALHTLFNFFILKSENNLFAVFGFVWIGVIILFLFFEAIKRRNRTCIVG